MEHCSTQSYLVIVLNNALFWYCLDDYYNFNFHHALWVLSMTFSAAVGRSNSLCVRIYNIRISFKAGKDAIYLFPGHCLWVYFIWSTLLPLHLKCETNKIICYIEQFGTQQFEFKTYRCQSNSTMIASACTTSHKTWKRFALCWKMKLLSTDFTRNIQGYLL